MGYLTRTLIRRKWESNRRLDSIRLAHQPLPTGVEVLEGLPYLSSGHSMHTLNLYLPLGIDGPLPVIVDIHGGGWMYGDRELNRAYCMYLASQGWAVMGMSYRLLPEVDLLGQVQDIFASFHWLEHHAEAYCLDLDRLCLTGDSAGGHLTGLAACIQLDPSLQALYGVDPLSHPFRALAIAHGVCDVYRFNFLKPHLDKAVTREYLRMLFGPAGSSSPLWGHASFEDTAPALSLPPILVIASEPDRYYRQSRRLIDWLDRSPLAHETLLWTRAQGEQLTHVFEVSHWDWPESRETNDRTLDFFHRACSSS
ncbi:MAG: alpha/beta hydrolase [Oscillospiraceae bacterium]|jgi:acetyl esterase|nr:alpha/beta hydrolase [Oscillospiraceae bacterium]